MTLLERLLVKGHAQQREQFRLTTELNCVNSVLRIHDTCAYESGFEQELEVEGDQSQAREGVGGSRGAGRHLV